MKKILLTLIIFAPISLGAQEIERQVIANSGNHSTKGPISLEWTLGEPMVQTFGNKAPILTQGLHQPCIYATSLEEHLAVGMKVKVFPNPAADYIHIHIVGQEELQPRLKLHDLQGKCIIDRPLNKGAMIEEEVNLSSYPENIYILTILIGNGGSYKTYKIQKIN